MLDSLILVAHLQLWCVHCLIQVYESNGSLVPDSPPEAQQGDAAQGDRLFQQQQQQQHPMSIMGARSSFNLGRSTSSIAFGSLFNSAPSMFNYEEQQQDPQQPHQQEQQHPYATSSDVIFDEHATSILADDHMSYAVDQDVLNLESDLLRAQPSTGPQGDFGESAFRILLFSASP